jgi:hypothetical protein
MCLCGYLDLFFAFEFGYFGFVMSLSI